MIHHKRSSSCTLKVKIESPGDAVLVLLLGQQQLHRNTAVAGTEIMDGLRASGHGINRADFILKRVLSASLRDRPASV